MSSVHSSPRPTRRLGWLLHDNEGDYRDETFLHLRQVRAEIVTRATDRRMLARTIESAARRLADGMYIDDAERAEVANLYQMVETLYGMTPGTDRNDPAPVSRADGGLSHGSSVPIGLALAERILGRVGGSSLRRPHSLNGAVRSRT